jgi:hypothetical protein
MNAASVTCPNGHHNPAHQQYCGECGAALPLLCPNGHPNPPHQHFCGKCGAALEESARTRDTPQDMSAQDRTTDASETPPPTPPLVHRPPNISRTPEADETEADETEADETEADETRSGTKPAKLIIAVFLLTIALVWAVALATNPQSPSSPSSGSPDSQQSPSSPSSGSPDSQPQSQYYQEGYNSGLSAKATATTCTTPGPQSPRWNTTPAAEPSTTSPTSRPSTMRTIRRIKTTT